MKKYFYFLFVVSLICTNSEAKKIPGFFINKEGDTVCVTFDVTFGFFGQDAKIERIQEKIRYYDSLNNKNTLKPEDASEVVIVNSGDTIRMLSKANNLGLGSFLSRNGIFLRLIKDGPLKLFKYYESGSSTPGYNHSTNTVSSGYTYETEMHILQKKDGPLVRVRNEVNFRKEMSKYLSDCPELVKKIDQKQYRKDDIFLIVEEYNKNCR